MKKSTIAALFLISVLYAPAGFAGNAKELLGKWIEHLPGGKSMVTEFTTTTMGSYQADASGKPLFQSNPVTVVSYRDLGDTIAVDFQGGGGIVVRLVDRNTLRFEVPTSGPSFTRMAP